jgi:OOP family OmpA-OmpF porin
MRFMNSKFKTIIDYFRIVFVATTIMAIPSVSHAMEWYGGLSLGQARHEATVGDLLGSSFTTGSIDGNDGAFKLFAGMVLWDKYVGAEFGYVDLGEALARSGSSRASSIAKGYTASAVGLIPFTDRLGMILRIGVAEKKVTLTTSGPGVSPSSHSTDLNMYGGFGIQYDFSKNLGARVEVERYNSGSLGSPYINMISGGIVYRFGK